MSSSTLASSSSADSFEVNFFLANWKDVALCHEQLIRRAWSYFTDPDRCHATPLLCLPPSTSSPVSDPNATFSASKSATPTWTNEMLTSNIRRLFGTQGATRKPARQSSQDLVALLSGEGNPAVSFLSHGAIRVQGSSASPTAGSEDPILGSQGTVAERLEALREIPSTELCLIREDMERFCLEFYRAMPEVRRRQKDFDASEADAALQELAYHASVALMRDLDREGEGFVDWGTFKAHFFNLVGLLYENRARAEAATSREAQSAPIKPVRKHISHREAEKQRQVRTAEHDRRTAVGAVMSVLHDQAKDARKVTSGVYSSDDEASGSGDISSDISLNGDDEEDELDEETKDARALRGKLLAKWRQRKAEERELNMQNRDDNRRRRRKQRRIHDLRVDRVKRESYLAAPHLKSRDSLMSAQNVDVLNAPPDISGQQSPYLEARQILMGAVARHKVGAYAVLALETNVVRLKRVLAKPGRQRSQTDLYTLRPLVAPASMPFLAEYNLPRDVRDNLLRSLRYRELSAGEVLFREGDEPNGECYLILSGLLLAFKESMSSSLSSGKHIVGELSFGNSFGWLAMTTHEPRGATVMVNSPKAHLVVLNRTAFEHIVLRHRDTVYSEHAALLRSTPPLNLAAADVLERLSRCGRVMRTRVDQVIIQQGDRAQHVYVVKSGEFRVIRELPAPSSGRRKSRRRPKSMILDINLLGPFTLFGEVGVVLGQARTASVVSTSVGELLCFDRNAFRRSIDRDTSALLADLAHSYPSDDELQELLTLDNRWAGFRDNLVRAAKEPGPGTAQSLF